MSEEVFLFMTLHDLLTLDTTRTQDPLFHIVSWSCIFVFAFTCETRSEIGIRLEAKDLDRTVHDQELMASI